MIILLYAIIGIAAGLLAGLFGIAGGIVTVPCLAFIFTYLNFPKEYLMHLAIGTSLAAMVFNAISSTWSHHRRKAVIWSIFRSMFFGLLFGSLLGAYIARLLPSEILQHVFGVFEILVGLYFLFPKVIQSNPHHLPGRWALSALGAGIAAVSNILGIGGGLITVPILMACRVSAQKAIATSAATGLLISFLGAVAYLYFGMGEIHQKETIGYIYLPAFIVLSIATFFAAPYGAALAHRLPTNTLKKLFGAVLIVTGFSMVFLG